MKELPSIDNDVKRMKNALEQQHGREFSEDEALQALEDLKIFAEIAIDTAIQQKEREKLLKEFPKGFHLINESGPCNICAEVILGENTWFDKHGLKCMVCQTAINKKIIPATITKNDSSWYSKNELEAYFNIKGAYLNKCIKLSFLKSREIRDKNYRLHLQMFLIRDNKDVLPPKKLLKPKLVKIEENGKEYFALQCWYENVDVNTINQLMKYKIAKCLVETFSKPVKRERILMKKINPLFLTN